ncbi:hypothetical protein C9J12_28870 [Photobacterium frigidiphilum]|uniref:Uncharacterized protein n=1 Tax=Photobacterium frigidiphilum TaxID=264736 RepID=A0A2T3J627_9GAMM|nr:hypothetical protein C9J12_28870 [Photobacterium frigidiphilum]
MLPLAEEKTIKIRAKMKVVTPNISCTTANSPSTLNSTPKLRSKTCQLDVFVINLCYIFLRG